jgi:nucleoside-diphosphate-sugar epimerase
VARVLIVGCGCRGRALGAALVADGHAVRGTTRDPAGEAGIAAAGIEAVVADPDRLGTVLVALPGVSALVWLMGSATGPTAAAANGPRLQAMLEKLVDTPVRGFVYEAAGSAGPAVLAQGAETARAASQTWQMPVEVLAADPANADAWLAAARTAVERVLA